MEVTGCSEDCRLRSKLLFPGAEGFLPHHTHTYSSSADHGVDSWYWYVPVLFLPCGVLIEITTSAKYKHNSAQGFPSIGLSTLPHTEVNSVQWASILEGVGVCVSVCMCRLCFGGTFPIMSWNLPEESLIEVNLLYLFLKDSVNHQKSMTCGKREKVKSFWSKVPTMVLQPNV